VLNVASHGRPFPVPQIYFKNQVPAPGRAHPAHLPLHEVLKIVIDSFTSATERHIEVRHACFFAAWLALPRICVLTCALQVGDGLEMYIVLAKGRTLQSMGVDAQAQEVSARPDGERVFVLRRDLKKD
jgi:20S proteasome subunit beta 6